MPAFTGFQDEIKDGFLLPEIFVTRALPAMTSFEEVQVSLIFFKLLKSNTEDYLTIEDFLSDPGMNDARMSEDQIKKALSDACEHGLFLPVAHEGEDFYFLNSPHGRSIQRANANGVWRPEINGSNVQTPQRPNIFTLYEQNIGPLTPILSQILTDAENSYSAEWIEEAFQIAVKKNVRNWSYVEAILRSWKEKGRNETDRRNTQENPRNYIEGDLADFIKH